MAFNVNEFRTRMVGDGARPNLFEIILQGHPGQEGGEFSFFAKAAQLPGSSISAVPVYYFGRELKFPGNRTFGDWTVTIINDEGFEIRKNLERWSSILNSHVANVRDGGYVSPSSYSYDAVVTQYNKDGSAGPAYKFVGLFPVDIAPIELDWGSNDTIEEYSVTFAYQWWESDTGTTDAA